MFAGIKMRLVCLIFATAHCLRVAVLTTSDCRSASPVTHHEFGTQLAASLVVLLRYRELFPDWDAFLATRPAKWNQSPGSPAAKDAGCRELWDDLAGLYRARSGAELRLLDYDLRDFAMLDVVSRIPGKETDHSRGHWPSEAFAHLVLGARLLEDGYTHTVYVDADAWPLDDALGLEVPRVAGVGCVAALPAQCLEVDFPRGSAAGRAAKERTDEYRLVTDPALRARVAAAAASFGHGYRVVNGTNSGVVVYNNAFLKSARWAEWMHALVNVSRRGFYGDQTALTVALGRADVPVRWLHPRFNVAVTLPYSYVLSTCGEDALYAGRAARALGAAPVSIAHFTWGPKPWMKALDARRATHRLKANAVQNDGPLANAYRAWVRAALGARRVARYFSEGAMAPLPNATAPGGARLDPRPFRRCGALVAAGAGPCREAGGAGGALHPARPV